MIEKLLSVVFVTNNYTPYSGGVVSSITTFAQELINQGHKIFIITLDFLGEDHRDDPDYVYRVFCPIKFRYKNNYMAVPWFMRKQVAKIIGAIQPDIIHSHHPWLLGSAALHVARRSKIPILFTYHTLYEHYAHYVPLPQCITQPVIREMVKYYCEQVDCVIAPSSAVQGYLKNLVPNTPISLLPSPISAHFFDAVGGQPLPFQRVASPFKLLYVGRLVKEKDVHLLLELLAQLHLNEPNRYTLTLVGYGEHQEWLETYAYCELKLSREVVQFIGKKSKHELSVLYRTHDAFVFSSRSDTQGLVLAEAMACGLPVVALDGPGQRDIVEHGKNGFLTNSLDELVYAIQLIAVDQVLYARLCENARETALRYASQNSTKALVSTYRALLAKTGM